MDNFDSDDDDQEIIRLRQRHEKFKEQKETTTKENQKAIEVTQRRSLRSPLKDLIQVIYQQTSSQQTKSLKSIARKSFANDGGNQFVVESSSLPKKKITDVSCNKVVQRMQEKDLIRQENLTKKQEYFLKQVLKNPHIYIQEKDQYKPKPEINAKSRELTKSKKNQIELDTKSNIEKKKQPTVVLVVSTKSTKKFLNSSLRNEEFIKSQQDWLQQRNAVLLKQRFELKAKELDNCTHKPQLIKRRPDHLKSRTNTTENESQTSQYRLMGNSQFVSKNLEISIYDDYTK